MKRDLTDAWLRTLQPPAEGRLEVRDTRVVGLVLRLTSAGAATWSVRTRTRDGKQTRPKLGTWPALGISDARKAAKASLAQIQAGADPVEAKRVARDARRLRLAEATVATRLEEWQAARVTAIRSPWSDRYAAEVARVCRHDVIPALGKRPLVETSRGEWTALVAGKRKRAPAMAASLYRVVSSFLGHAEAEGWIPAPLLPRKGAGTLAPLPEARARVLTDAELAAVWEASALEAPKLRAYVRLLILTAARQLEVADIATGEIDLAAARWTILGERSKNGRPLTVPLCSLALAELQAVWPEHGEAAGNSWRLLGKFAGSGFRGYGKLKARLDDRISAARAEVGLKPPALPAWRWHDLRRTARTGMTRLGVPRDHAEAAINHVSGRSALERTYDRHDYAPEVLAALESWQEHVAAIINQPSGTVVTGGTEEELNDASLRAARGG